MLDDGKIKSNSNFNLSVENEIVWCIVICEIKWIMLIIYHVEILT
jgi:hypothetical protein